MGRQVRQVGGNIQQGEKGMKAWRSVWTTVRLRRHSCRHRLRENPHHSPNSHSTHYQSLPSSWDSTSIKHLPAESQKRTVIPLPSPAKDPCYSNMTILIYGVEKVLMPPIMPHIPDWVCDLSQCWYRCNIHCTKLKHVKERPWSQHVGLKLAFRVHFKELRCHHCWYLRKQGGIHYYFMDLLWSGLVLWHLFIYLAS